MDKSKNNIEISFEDFLKNSLTVTDFENVHLRLRISKKMFTIILREPSKIKTQQLIILSRLTQKPLDSFVPFIEHI